MKLSELKKLVDQFGSVPAIWKNADFDCPIAVTGVLGKDSCGKSYVSVLGSNSGIPLNEIVFKQSVLTRMRNG